VRTLQQADPEDQWNAHSYHLPFVFLTNLQKDRTLPKGYVPRGPFLAAKSGPAG